MPQCFKTQSLHAALLLTCLTRAAAFDPYAGPQPVAVYRLTEPGKLIIGDTAFGPVRAAVYPNRQLLFRRDIQDRPEYLSTQLSESEFATLVASGRAFLNARPKRRYDLAPGAFDIGTGVFSFRDGDRKMKTGIYGWVCGRPELPPFWATIGTGRGPDALPKSVMDFATRLCGLTSRRGRPWRPRYIQLSLGEQPHTYKPVSWPHDWPTLDSERAVKDMDAYVIFLDGERLPELRRFLRVHENSTFILGGRNWAIESYEQVLPGVPTYSCGDKPCRSPKEHRPMACAPSGDSPR